MEDANAARGLPTEQEGSKKIPEGTPKMTFKRAGSIVRAASQFSRMASDDSIPGVTPLPEVWEKPSSLGEGKGQKVEVGRMIDDLLRQGYNDDMVKSFMQQHQIEFFMQVGITAEQIEICRRKQNRALRGVPVKSRPAYREALVNCLGSVLIPWDTKKGGMGTNRLELAKLGMTSMPLEILRPPFSPEVRVLNLTDNQIEEVPPEISNCSELTQLKLFGNKLKSIPVEIVKLNRLKLLWLGSNKLKSVPNEVGRLTGLEALSLDQNELEMLPITLGRLSGLKELRVDKNPKMYGPPKHIVTMGRTRIMHYLRLMDHGDMTGVLTLKELNLTELPREMLSNKVFNCLREHETTIRELYLDQNKLSAIDDEIMVVGTLENVAKQLSNLRVLSLANNTLRKVPHVVCNLSQLRTLNLEKNSLIKNLPVEMGNLTNLTSLQLTLIVPGGTDRQYASPPKEILNLAIDPPECDDNGECIREGSAGIVVHYLRMIQDAKHSKRLYHMRMGLRALAPELVVLAEGEHGLPGASFGTEAEVAQRAHADRMSRIYMEPLGQLIELEYMNLSRNRLTKLPSCIAAFKHLRVLALAWNSLLELPDSIGDLAMLEELSAAFNKLESLPKSMSKCRALSRVDLHCNRLSQLTKMIGEWKVLEVLRLEGNRLETLPSAIGLCRSLLVLNVTDNKLKALPDSIVELGQLQILAVDGNLLTAIPEKIGQCSQLGQLSLDRNDLDILPMSIGFMRKLQVLSAADNPRLLYPPQSVFKTGIQVVRTFFVRIQASLQNYKLNLSHMRMSDFPLGLETNVKLQSLDMSHNEIKVIPDAMSQLQNLTTVRLQFNRIRQVPEGFGTFKHLTSLHLNNNVLTTLPQSLAALDRLTDLCIQANKIVTLPMCIGALLNLRSFSASDNPLQEPPEDIVNGKNSSRLTYNYMRGVFDAMSSGCMTLEGFGLQHIPDPAIKLTTLDAIMLGKNRISTIPDSISRLRYLRKLSLKQNVLVSLTPSLAKMCHLQILTLTDNKLTSFDPVLLEITSLKTLSIDKNQILSVPERIDKMFNLISLVLSENPISRLPGNICKLTALTELRFRSTKVRKIPMSYGTLSMLRALEMDAEVMEEPRPEVCMAPLPVLMNYFFEFLKCYQTQVIDVAGHSIRAFPTEFFTFRHHESKQILGYQITSMDISRNHLTMLPEDFANFEALTRLDLSYNSFHRVPGALCWLTQIDHLNLEGNYHLTRLPLEMGEMKNLRELKLSVSRFLTPPQEVITKVAPNDHHEAHLGLIEYLQLLIRARDTGKIKMSRMGLRQFPPELLVATSMCWDFGEIRGIFMTGRGKLDAIEEVYLDHNNIQQLPASIGQMLRVKIFDLSSNYLRVLPASIANMTQLTTLNLSSNKLCLINPIISMLTSLTKLQLQDNQLSVIPEVVCDLFNVREVSFSQNRLTELPHNIPKLTNLCNLLASENRLKTDPSNWGLPGVSHELAYMPNLIELNLEKNDLIKVPPKDVRHSSSENQLRFLKLVHEARSSAKLILKDLVIRDVPEILILLQSLHTLSIASCGLRSVNPNIKRLTNLTYLELDDNDLVVIPEDATRISNLTELHVSKNQMKKLPETCNRWIRCSKIYATDNHIKTIPDGVCEMPNLTILDLDRNKLKTLPEAFIICTNLTLLHFDTSDMVKASPAKELPDGIRRCEIPAEIAIRGVDMIIDHFFKMHEAWSTNSLDLQRIGLRYVMDDVCRLSVLTKLDLSHNRLKCLPSAMSSLPELKLVNLDHNMGFEHFHHDLWVLTKLKKITIRAGILDSWLRPIIQMKWPPTIVARQPQLCRQYLKVLFDCVGRHYRKDGIDTVESTGTLDYRFIPHEVSLDPVTAGEIDSEAKRSFSDFPHEIWHLGLTNLTWLQLPGGTITSEQCSKHLPKLTHLKKLVLIDQEIDRIVDEVGLLEELNVLCLTGNKIKEIPDFIFKMISMTKLILVENYIEKIPPEIGLLTNLTDLVLTYNKISVLPKEIGELWGLDYFVLDENKIRVLPDTIQNLTSLKELSFNDNKITRLPASIGNLTQLDILEFAKNPPFSLPPKQVLKCEVPVILGFMNKIWDCRVTGKLYFRNFQLDDPTVKQIVLEVYSCVTDLDLSKNYLKHLTSNLKSCTGLTKINLSENSELRHLNLQSEIEIKKREVKKAELITTNLTLRTFFENIEMMHLYEIVSKEYGVKKMKDLSDFIQNENAMENLGLNPLEKMRFIDAVYKVNGEPDSEAHQDKIEQSSASEVQSSDVDSGKEEAEEEAEEDDEKKEDVLDDEEAQRLLEDAKGNKLIKVDMEMLKGAAYRTKVLFYEMVVMVKAKLIERQRRKELAILDKRVEKRANGFRKKLMRQDAYGLDANVKKKLAEKKKKAQAMMSQEEADEKLKVAMERKAEMMKARDEAIGGNVQDIDLKIEVGGGIVKESIYSLAIFTNLTDLRVRKCRLEYIPEDLGDLTGLTHLDLAKNDIRWFPPSFTNLVNLKDVDIRNNLIFELPTMIGNCCELRELRLDHNKLYDLPQSMAEMPHLKKVTLDYNKFQILPGWLDELEHLNTLSFSYNEVDKLPSTFHLLGTTLTELRCCYNKLSQLSTMFSALKQLKILDVSGNPIKNVPKHMGQCEGLEELYVNFCSLETMDIHLAECRKLSILKYEGNELMSYPPREVQVKGPAHMLRFFKQICDCPKNKMMLLDKFDLAEFDDTILNYPRLTWLDMADNNMMKIPAEIRQLQFVELVNFSRNKLGGIPRILCMMQTINDLSLDGNGIERIEPSIMLLTGLTRLSLSRNKINRIHPSIFRLTNLELLNFNDNEIAKIPGLIASLHKLDSLGLGSNIIEEIPSEIRALTALRQLVLYGNQLKTLPNGMRSLTTLEVLTVSQNSLREFSPSIAMGLVNLRELWLTHNKLKYIPPEIRFMSRLEQLWLQDNRLMVLPHELGNLTTLKVLTLTGNQLTEIPPHIKNLRITKEKDRAEDEEFWQDKEKDGFTMKDADRLLMQWGSDPKATQDVFNEANNLMFSGALQTYYYAHKDQHIQLKGEAGAGKKVDHSDADDEEEPDVLAWEPPKKGKKKKIEGDDQAAPVPRTAADDEYEAENDFANIEELVKTAQEKGQHILSNSLTEAERVKLESGASTRTEMMSESSANLRTDLRTASAYSSKRAESGMSSAPRTPADPELGMTSTPGLNQTRATDVSRDSTFGQTGTTDLSGFAASTSLNQTRATDVSGASTLAQTRATNVSGASTLNQTRATEISVATTVRQNDVKSSKDNDIG